jgi:hypothetical protein
MTESKKVLKVASEYLDGKVFLTERFKGKKKIILKNATQEELEHLKQLGNTYIK